MLKLSITIPAPIERVVIAFTVTYRRLRYGFGYMRIKLTKGQYAIVDADDFLKLSKYKWHAKHKFGETFYAERLIKTRRPLKSISMHREIMNPPKHLWIDHINRNGLDNRKANLRFATPMQNAWNRTKPNIGSSKYRGVGKAKGPNPWRATIHHNGQKIHLGMFKNEIDAAKAYDTEAKKRRGEFAVLNFPD